jgi:putative tricarboxylic transport membrane protein
MLHSLWIGVQTACSPLSLVFTVIGVAVGILGGAMPGINASITTALLLPFTYNLSPGHALMMLVGVYIGVNYGGSIPAILIGTPGTPSAGATLLDGYPMRQKGRASEALNVALTSSTIGNLVSGVILVAVALPLAKAALKFGFAEYFALGVLGLTLIAGLTEKNVIKGLLAAGLGLLLSTVGADEFLGKPRFAFGSINLAQGLDLVPVMMGLFALAMMIQDFWEPPELEEGKENIKLGLLPKGVLKKIFPISIGCGVLGTFIGALPGAGAAVASFIAYNQAKTMSKTPEIYGTGCAEGVAASESSNNGVTGGALIPMLGLGIPGSGTTAVILSAMVIHGVTPGPNLFISKPEIPYGIFIAVFTGTVFMYILGLFYTRAFLKIIMLPQEILNTAIVAIVLTGAYAVQRDIFDLCVVFIMGIFGFFLRRCKVPISPIVLGLVLGGTVERSMRRALTVSNGNWGTFFTRPLSAILLVLAVVMLVFTIYRSNKPQKKAAV